MADLVDFSVAVCPNDLGSVSALAKSIATDAAELSSGDDAARHALIIKARTLVQSLETPRETMTKHTWAQASSPRLYCPGGVFLDIDFSTGISQACLLACSQASIRDFGSSWSGMGTVLKRSLNSPNHSDSRLFCLVSRCSSPTSLETFGPHT